jgi:hypothetical protein
MYKEFFALPVLVLLSACGGSEEPLPPAPHCSEATVLEAHLSRILTAYTIKTNTCNQISSADITDDDFYAVHGKRVYRSSYDVTGYNSFRSASYSLSGHITFVELPATENTPSYQITYTVQYSDDFITKYNEYTTNTDVIYSSDDEYKLILDYSHPDFVLADFNEAIKDIKDANITYK